MSSSSSQLNPKKSMLKFKGAFSTSKQGATQTTNIV
jgi:hypothetical protein